MSADEEFDDIPTLSNIVFPGNPEKIIEKRAATNPGIDLSAESERQTSTKTFSTPDLADIQDEIDKAVESVLAKHFFQARQQIVEEIMQELRKKLP